MHKRHSPMPWFRRGDYNDIKRLMAGGATWALTYDEWLQDAEAQEKAIRDSGCHVERVMIEPWEFEVWCAAMGLAMDESARLQFATENSTGRPTPRDCSPAVDVPSNQGH
jgi:hypothetical protein